MSLAPGYSSGEEDPLISKDVFELSSLPLSKKIRTKDSAAPSPLNTQAASDGLLNQTSLVTRLTDTQMKVNILCNDMMLAVEGPETPFGERNHFLNQNALARHVEEQSSTIEHAFRSQYLTHSILGYSSNPSVDPNAPSILGLVESEDANGFATIDTLRATKNQRKELKRKRKHKGSVDIVDGDGAYVGPWASWEGEEPQNHFLAGLDGAEELEEDGDEEPEPDFIIKKSKPERDYQGRTYMTPPIAEAPSLLSEAGSQDCFIPKVLVHTWTGHTQGVSVIRTFPETGHLLLSGSMDTKIKLWDIYTHRSCMRTFHGHDKAVKDVSFSNDGRQFLSCGYDRQMKLWDTETGQCLKRFHNGKFHMSFASIPMRTNNTFSLLACPIKRLYRSYDTNSGEITQEYDQHLGPVNTITFVDENRGFVTTSDDKTIRAWDFDIPAVIKYIAEPHMHSMPAVTLHPSRRYLAAQSLDNQILIYSTDNFRQNRKKRFAGHSVAGYACQVGFSPDGKWISSGDGEGNVVFWDWKTGRIKSRLKAHSKVVIAHEWLPHETSRVITASWDGLIKLWWTHDNSPLVVSGWIGIVFPCPSVAWDIVKTESTDETKLKSELSAKCRPGQTLPVDFQ
ncbi:pre-mRNA splicing factor [Infundibulicybe gibba]|nr:pre-mRNA splicing factor [Infundibulicybe gibba]